MNKIYIDDTESYIGFVIVQTGDRTYVCPNWHEVPNGTTRDQIEFTGEPRKVTQPVETQEVAVENKEWSLPGSKPGVMYTISIKNNKWDCTCPARQFRRGDCKHIKSIKEAELV